jgi:hypothetical protein
MVRSVAVRSTGHVSRYDGKGLVSLKCLVWQSVLSVSRHCSHPIVADSGLNARPSVAGGLGGARLRFRR